MASITKYYSIPTPVPFENVDVNTDTRRFIDPFRVRHSSTPQPFAGAAVALLDDFFDTVTTAVQSTSPTQRNHARNVLCRFTEPWETRLGLSRRGYRGHGGAADTGAAIWRALTTNVRALVMVGVLKRLEDLPLFVEDVADDITSDITTRVIYSALVDFTTAMMRQYPQLRSVGTVTIQRQVWDRVSHDWVMQPVTLPAPNSRALLLVPKEWVRHRITMAPTRFYETTLLSYAQEEQKAVLNGGKTVQPPKWSLKKQASLKRGRGTHITVAQRAHQRGYNLVQDFRDFVASRP